MVGAWRGRAGRCGAVCVALLGFAQCTTFGSDPAPATLVESGSGAPDAADERAVATRDASDQDVGVDADASFLGCNEAVACERVVFVTSTKQAGGALNGLVGADALCTQLAATALHARVRGRRFVAWLSGPADAASRMVKGSRPYVLANGTEVAAQFAQFASATHGASINVDENGAPTSGETAVWTGSDENGKATPVTCSAWATANPADNGKIGRSTRMDKSWSNDGTLSCQSLFHLYCVER